MLRAAMRAKTLLVLSIASVDRAHASPTAPPARTRAALLVMGSVVVRAHASAVPSARGAPVALLLSSAQALRRVSTTARRRVEATPEKTKQAWLSHTWGSGGGVPAVILREPSDAAVPTSRVIAPAGMREELLDSDDEMTIRYRVTDSGLLGDVSGPRGRTWRRRGAVAAASRRRRGVVAARSRRRCSGVAATRLPPQVVASSHESNVTFSDAPGGACDVRWDVSFDVTSRADFWKKATDSLVGAAADDLARYAAEPTEPFWFDPLREFGLADEAVATDKPLLLVLPGLDGSSVTAWMQSFCRADVPVETGRGDAAAATRTFRGD